MNSEAKTIKRPMQTHIPNIVQTPAGFHLINDDGSITRPMSWDSALEQLVGWEDIQLSDLCDALKSESEQLSSFGRQMAALETAIGGLYA